MKPDHVILGVHVTDRFREAAAVQKVFTEYGLSIKTRLGLHEIGNSPEGIVLLELVGEPSLHQAMRAELEAIEGIEVQAIVFGH